MSDERREYFRIEDEIALDYRMVSEDEGIRIVDAWLNAQFEGGRHLRRIQKIEPHSGPEAGGKSD